jgi:putative endonuclease
MDNNNYSVYVIYSQTHNRIYVGMSDNIPRRLVEHNNGKCSSSKHYKPWILIYQEFVGQRAEARKKEKYFKSGFGREFVKKFIPGYLPADRQGAVQPK